MQLVFACAWLFLLCTVVIDCTLGDQALVTYPHWSRPPMTRMSSLPHAIATPLGGGFLADSKPVLPEQMAWTEEHRKIGAVLAGPQVRRLSARASERSDRHAPAALRTAMQNLMQALPSTMGMNSNSKVAAVSWPVFFEPGILACGPGGAVAAVTPRGFGATAPSSGGGNATSFRLGGLGRLLPILAATWGRQSFEAASDQEGLLLVSRHGDLAVCPGEPQDRWMCSESTVPRLPLAEGSHLSAAAAAWMPASKENAIVAATSLYAAMLEAPSREVSPRHRHVVSIWSLAGSAWEPMGDVALPRGVAHVSLSFLDGALLISTDGGHVIRRRMQDGAVMENAFHTVAAPTSDSEASWQAACQLQNAGGGIAHLQLRRGSGAHAWRPELLISGATRPAEQFQ